MLISLKQIFIIYFALLKTLSGSPQVGKASECREFIIETEAQYNWFEAFHECARRDYQLVVIDSEAKNKVVIDLLKRVVGKSYNLWLGGNDQFSARQEYNRPFFWAATGKKFDFAFWAFENPDNYEKREHCVHIWDIKPLFQWNDGECTAKMGFICESKTFCK